MLKEFKTFIARGNVLDLAVGVVIGAAFGKIVDSFVKDIIMPPIGLLTGGVDFTNKFLVLKGDGVFKTLEEAQKAGAITLNVGAFINTVLTFLIVAFAVFLVVKAYNRMKKAPEAAPVTEKPCPHCKMSIPLDATRCGHCTSQLA